MPKGQKFAEEKGIKGAVPVVTEETVRLYAVRINIDEDNYRTYVFRWRGERPEDVAQMLERPENLLGTVRYSSNGRFMENLSSAEALDNMKAEMLRATRSGRSTRQVATIEDLGPA